jgi:hypothetical protein
MCLQLQLAPLPNGSYMQRVQAEYLKEVEDRGKSVYLNYGK